MEASFSACLDHVTGGEAPRVWSLIVTLFGDLAQGADDRLGVQTITRITSEIGIKPEATRVALHRLRSDGWLSSQRIGRGSEYGLTDMGRAETTRVSPRIYGAQVPDRWHMVLAGVAQRDLLDPLIEARSHVLVAPGMAVGGGSAPDLPPDLLALDGGEAQPDWLRDALCPAELQEASQSLLARLQAARPVVPETLGPAQAAALRVSVVHEWRRLILRSPYLPAELFPDGWQGQECRAVIDDLLSELPRPKPGAIG